MYEAQIKDLTGNEIVIILTRKTPFQEISKVKLGKRRQYRAKNPTSVQAAWTVQVLEKAEVSEEAGIQR